MSEWEAVRYAEVLRDLDEARAEVERLRETLAEAERTSNEGCSAVGMAANVGAMVTAMAVMGLEGGEPAHGGPMATKGRDDED